MLKRSTIVTLSISYLFLAALAATPEDADGTDELLIPSDVDDIDELPIPSGDEDPIPSGGDQHGNSPDPRFTDPGANGTDPAELRKRGWTKDDEFYLGRESAEDRFNTIDLNADGYADFDEIHAMHIDMNDESIRQTYKDYSILDQLKDMIGNRTNPYSQPLDEEIHAKRLQGIATRNMEMMDTDKDGKLDPEEFLFGWLAVERDNDKKMKLHYFHGEL